MFIAYEHYPSQPFYLISDTMESTTSLSSTKKPRWRRGLGTVRRLPSRVFKKPNIRSSSPTPSEREPRSDSISIKGFSNPSSLELLPATVATSPPAAAGNSKRETAPLAAEPGGHGVLMRGGIVAPSRENTREHPIITNEIASDHAPPAAAEQLVLTSEPEEEVMTGGPEATSLPADEQELVPTHATKPLHGTEEPAGSSLAHFKDTPEPLESEAAVPVGDIPAPHSEAPVPETAPSTGELTGTSSIEATSFDMPTLQENTRTGLSTKTSYESLAIAGVGRGNGDEDAGYKQGNSTVL